jgi:hypothetical protein
MLGMCDEAFRTASVGEAMLVPAPAAAA